MFVEISRGRSFKGLAQYCLHDVDRRGADRVAFTETRNLGTEDPQVAWRIMAARHYLQDDLKEQAGVGRGGAKDGKPVGHLLISWKKDEADSEQLNRQGMIQAAQGALRAIGAQDHQALIIGHDDTEHPHCHIIINLIGEDGRLKKNWKEREKLSRFALEREKAVHGEAVVKQREKNWLDREAGETPAPVRKKQRHLYELDKAAAQCPETAQFARRHRAQLAELERAKAALQQRQRRQHALLQEMAQLRQQQIAQDTQQRLRRSKGDIRQAHQQPWRDLLDLQSQQRQRFEENERNLKGSLANAMRLINWKQLLRRRDHLQELRLRDAFDLLTSETVRREALRTRQEDDRQRLRAEQRRQEEEQAATLLQDQQERLRQERQRLLRTREALNARQQRAREQLKQQQQVLTRERNDALKQHHARQLQQQREFERPPLDRSAACQTTPENDTKRLNQTFEQSVQADGSPTPSSSGRVRRPRKPRPPREPRQSSDTTTPELSRSDEPSAQNFPPQKEFESRMKAWFAERAQDRSHEDHER